jgi:hypothetical protein
MKKRYPVRGPGMVKYSLRTKAIRFTKSNMDKLFQKFLDIKSDHNAVMSYQMSFQFKEITIYV